MACCVIRSKLAAGLRFTPGTAGRPPAQSVARNAPGQGPPQMPARPRGQPRGGRGSERDKSPRQLEPSGRLFEGPATLARCSITQPMLTSDSTIVCDIIAYYSFVLAVRSRHVDFYKKIRS